MLASEIAALRRAQAVYAFLDAFKADATRGRHDEAGRALSMALGLASEGVPQIAAVLAAQGEPAEGGDLPQRRMRVICAIGVAAKHPDAANSQANLTEQPVPSVP